METENLFRADEIENVLPPRREVAAEPPRVLTANREQLFLRTCDYESLIGEDHVARMLWAAVERLDLSKFYEPIAARGSEPGRPAIDPKIQVALWLQGTADGIGSARELARRCETDDVYRWICGGVSVNYHTLSDFRVGHGGALDDLMTQVLGVLIHSGLVEVERVAHDGMRVRASAGAASFHREKSLRASLEAAREQVERVKKEAEAPEAQRSDRQQAARERAAREREERVRRALSELPKAREAKKTEEDKKEARVSTTDPEARVMKMADGGYRPAYNVQLASDTASKVVVGVRVTNAGSDGAQTEPMLAEIERRTEKAPKEYLADGGFVNREAIEQAAQAGVTTYEPVPKPRQQGVDPHQPKPGDAPAVAAWRERMGTPEAKEIYKERAATAELVNADLRAHRGLNAFLVRGTTKVLSVVLWSAITYNLLRWIAMVGVT